MVQWMDGWVDRRCREGDGGDEMDVHRSLSWAQNRVCVREILLSFRRRSGCNLEWFGLAYWSV
jgi:hypothetical protein